MAKRPRSEALDPEDLTVGTAVVFWGDRTGVVSDAFGPLDQFWIRDDASDEVVRDDDGNIVAFSASDLQLAAAPTQAREKGHASARVLLVGTEQQMLRIIEHFGPPDGTERREPQMLLAVPCSSCCCGPTCARFESAKLETCDRARCPLLKLAASGIEDGMFDLARTLRPDRAEKLGIRAFHLKQAVEQMGPDLLRLDDYYCLSAVTLPFGVQAIEAASGWERYTMEEVRCQIDLGVTAEGPALEGEALDWAAQRILGEACGIRLSESIWEEEVQFKLRKLLNVDIPLKYFDGPDAKGFVLILPSDLEAFTDSGLLTFREPSDGSKAPVRVPQRPPVLHGGDVAVGGKSVAEWKLEQSQFGHLPKLPEGWIRIKSRSSNDVYYYNTKTQTSTFEFPLPEGWTKQKSKSTGKTYYFNAKKRKSVYEVPTEP